MKLYYTTIEKDVTTEDTGNKVMENVSSEEEDFYIDGYVPPRPEERAPEVIFLPIRQNKVSKLTEEDNKKEDFPIG